VRSRTAAALLGIPLHLAGDRVPHRHIADRRVEIGSALLIVGLVAKRRGITDKATIGALTACLPDVEHIIRLPRPGGSKLFHERRGWHREGRLSPRVQLLIATLLVGRIFFTPEAGAPSH
jgi:DNA-binding transcriptional LysR family regulator